MEGSKGVVDTNSRIAKNTLFLYFRMMIIIAINLFAVRIILQVLGVEDYGIYNVVGGIVTLFSFLSSSLASGAQRFIAYGIGCKDGQYLVEIFSMTMFVYWGIAIVIFLLLETIGLWFLNNKMNIPSDRMVAVNWVFQMSIVSFLINIVLIPYNAVIIAWEKMSFFAYISIVEAVSKLIAVICLLYVAGDKLILYSLVILLNTIVLYIIYREYCKKKLDYCELIWKWDPSLCKSLLTYSGWNIIGVIALILRNQGVNILLNLFFNPIVNAAHTIGQQINSVISQFINNIYLATRPQITKQYAAGEKNAMWKLVYSSSKFSYFLLYLLCLPVFLEIDTILKLWLGMVPEYTSMIVRFLLIVLLIETSVNQLIAVFQAANKLRKYQSYSSVILLLNIPLAYIFLKFTSDVFVPYLISAILSLFYVSVLLYTAYSEIKLDIKCYVSDVLIKIVKISLLSPIIPCLICCNVPESFLRVLYTFLTSALSVVVVTWLGGLSLTERTYIKQFIHNKIVHKS